MKRPPGEWVPGTAVGNTTFQFKWQVSSLWAVPAISEILILLKFSFDSRLAFCCNLGTMELQIAPKLGAIRDETSALSYIPILWHFVLSGSKRQFFEQESELAMNFSELQGMESAQNVFAPITTSISLISEAIRVETMHPKLVNAWERSCLTWSQFRVTFEPFILPARWKSQKIKIRGFAEEMISV